MTPLDHIVAELRELGYMPRSIRPAAFDFELATLDYHVENGRYRGSCFRIGIGFQEDAYPEYPPHWICVAAMPDTAIRMHSSFRHDGCEWSVFSVPPSDFWDNLAVGDKNMKTYLRRHLPRFWSQV